MTSLRSALEHYISIRQGLGSKYIQPARRLSDFVTFMEQQGADVITTKLALAWATLPPDRQPSWSIRLTDVRCFARHLVHIDPRTEVPPVKLLPPIRRAKPYIYSDTEIDALLAAALQLPPTQGLRRWTYHCFFGLIAVAGLRHGEALYLRRKDVDLDDGILTVRETKYGKSRFVPLHPTHDQRPGPLRRTAGRPSAIAMQRLLLCCRTRWPAAASICPPRVLALVTTDRTQTAWRAQWASYP